MLSITHYSAKVIYDFLRTYEKDLPRPQRKMLCSLVKGMIQSESVQLCAMGRSVKGRIKPKTFCEEAENFLKNTGSLQTAHNRRLRGIKFKMLILDESEIQKYYAKKIKGIIPVRDGSTGDLKGQGYGLIGVVGITDQDKVILLLIRRYEELQRGRMAIINEVLEIIGPDQDALWILDRGFDDQKIIKKLLDEGQQFILRLDVGKSSRKLLVQGEGFQVGQITAHMQKVGYVEVRLPDRSEKLNLVYYDHGRKEALHVLTTLRIKSLLKAKRVAQGYLKRWKIEDYFRFIKQRFQLEKIMLQKLKYVDGLMHVLLVVSSLIMEKMTTIDQKIKYHYQYWCEHEQATPNWSSFCRFLKSLFAEWGLQFRTRFKCQNRLQLLLFDY